MDNIKLLDAYHMPIICKDCGGVMVFKGLGEYKCEDCGSVEYDDYGKVRGYLEEHPGANAVEVEDKTGVAQKTIRQMLRDARIQVSENSQTFLHCEFCGKNIRYGRVCMECEGKVHRNIEEHQRKVNNLHGFGLGNNADEGHRRFMRDSDR